MRKKDPAAMALVRARPCLLCGSKADAAHVKSRGSGGDDVADNLVPLCRRHHQEQHRWGWVKFVMRYPVIGWELEEKGWTIQTTLGIAKLVRR